MSVFRVFGRVTIRETGQPLADLMVTVLDADSQTPGKPVAPPTDQASFAATGDWLGTAVTDHLGRFELSFDTMAFQDANETRPDLLIAVLAPLTSDGSGTSPRSPWERLLHFTTYPRVSAGHEEGFTIRLRQDQVETHALLPPSVPAPVRDSRPPKPGAAFRAAADAEDSRRRDVAAAANLVLGPKVMGALEHGGLAKRVAASFTTVDPALRDDPFVIPDRGSRRDRRDLVRGAASMAIGAGLDAMAGAPAEPLAIRVDGDTLHDLVPEGVTLDGRTVSLSVVCGLLHAASGGYSLTRTRTLRDVAQRLRRLRGSDAHPGEDDRDGEPEADAPVPPPADPASTMSERIRRLVEAQVADVVMSAPPEEPLPRLPLQRLKVELNEAVLAGGPADTTAYHDVHTLQLAYPNVWVEALDPSLRGLIELVYAGVNRLVRDAGLSADEVLESEIEDLREFIAEVAQVADAVADARRGTLTDEVLFLWPHLAPHWHLLDAGEAAYLIEVATEEFPAGSREEPPRPAMSVYRTYGSFETAQRQVKAYELARGEGGRGDTLGLAPTEPRDAVEIVARAATGRAMLARIVWSERMGAPDATTSSEETLTPRGRLERLLAQMATMLTERYAFEYFAPESVNFGIVITYRQRWVPGSYQVGDMVGTVPLAPGETRRLQVKESRVVKRATKEVERALWTRAGESTRTVRATEEIVRRAESSTNFAMTAQGSFQIGIGSFGGTSSFTHNQSLHTQATKNDFREAVVKASHEYRNERTLEVDASEEATSESTTTAELSNPNNELTVTYLLYELERQFRVSEQIHRLQPVILVAQPMPGPGEITESWLLRYEWILRRVLLDDSLVAALNDLHGSFAGDEVSIALKRANWEAQSRIVETLEGEHSHWLSVKRQLNRDLVDAQYRERVAEAADEAGGFLADIGQALVFDAGGLVEGALEARRKMVEDHLKWIHDELQQSAEKLATAREALNSATAAYSAAIETRVQRRMQVDQLRVHVKDNILYYMQAIWSHEPSDQRYFRLHNVPVLFPDASTATCRVRAATEAEAEHPVPGAPPLTLVIEDCGPPRWDPSAAVSRKLHEVAEIDKPLGFKGNYIILPLRACSLITDYMMRSYVDSYFGVRDPDPLSEFSLDELMEYRAELDPDQRRAVDDIVTARLASPAQGETTVVVPTGHLYLEALLGGHTLLEPFKLAHRGYDAALARERLRQLGLENLRYAARIVADEPALDDPETERTVVTGTATASVDT